MMGTTVFIIDSPLHFIFTIAIIKKLNISNYSIHWFNKTSLQVYFPENIYIDKYNIIDFNRFLVQFQPNKRELINTCVKLLQSNYVKEQSIDDIVNCMKDKIVFTNPAFVQKVGLENLSIVNIIKK